MSFIEAYNNFKKFQSEFENEAEGIIQKHKTDLVELVKDQLYSGLNGRDKPLRPTYSTDPFFNTPEAGHWKGRAKAYAKWKMLETPPESSSIGHPPRDYNTPNLTIKNVFYDSIAATNIKEGVSIGSNTSLGKDIESKYGSIVFGIGDYSKEYFINHIFRPYWKDFINKYK